MEVWEKGLDFKEILLKNEKVQGYLSKSEIDELFNMNKIKKNINKVFEKLNLK